MQFFRFVVLSADAGLDIRTYLIRVQGFSRQLVKGLRLGGGVTVNGEARFLNYKLMPGDLVVLTIEELKEQAIVPEDIAFGVLFEDEHVLVVNKPAGLVVHPTKGYASGTLANAVVHYWQQQGHDYVFRPVNRLDRDTSGIVVVAKNPFVQESLIRQGQQGSWYKFYTAVVQGHLTSEDGVIDAPIARVGNGSRARFISDEGKPSRTLWQIKERLQGASVVEAQLITGRTHQIRVHFAHIGHPLLGDEVYGEPSALIDRQALHASCLNFLHPVTKERVQIVAPLPCDMQRLVQELRF